MTLEDLRVKLPMSSGMLQVVVHDHDDRAPRVAQPGMMALCWPLFCEDRRRARSDKARTPARSFPGPIRLQSFTRITSYAAISVAGAWRRQCAGELGHQRFAPVNRDHDRELHP